MSQQKYYKLSVTTGHDNEYVTSDYVCDNLAKLLAKYESVKQYEDLYSIEVYTVTHTLEHTFKP